jgi:pimeloyl-ACP methyl ester carboxylesterase
VHVPTLLVRGTRTTLAANAVSARLAATLPTADLVEVADAGHMLPVTHAARVNAAIEAHLAQADAEALLDAAA